MTPAAKIRIHVLAVLAIAVLGALFAFPKGPNWIRKEVKLHLGLDLAGGAHLEYEADLSKIDQQDREPAVEATRNVIEERVNALGVGEALVQTNKTQEGYRVIVELPGVTDIKQAIQRIGDTPILEFKEQAEPIPLTADEKASRAQFNEEQKQKTQNLLKELRGSSDETFAQKAKEVSEDPGSQEKGGDLDFAEKGMFVPEFDTVIFEKLKDGEMHSEIVETLFGYHIIRRVESRCKNTKENKVVPCEEKKEGSDVADEVRSRHILFRKLSLEPEQPADQWKNTKLSGEYLKRAGVQFDQQSGFPIVALEFGSEGARLFEEITGRNIDKQVAIFLDGNLVSAPRVQQKISGGNAVITGTFTVTEAQELAKRLNAGALPVPITIVVQEQVGATLGAKSVEQGFLAGIIGMILVTLFMIAFYRLPGVVASISLLIYTLIIISLFKLIPVVLTLSGIAGFIMSVGIAVDANVLIFERIKEELAAGKTLHAAIDEGFSRAWSAIRDSNFSTLITCFVLIWLGESLIKGFGITLSIGVLASMFTAITVNRVLLKFIASRGKSGGWMWGVKNLKFKMQNSKLC
ncbi:MAG: protein translocase subunit SecD [Candidatus Jacksonbacteria bacterium]|nr:protein translocase subunit SecD [Candidatus Jacksonbacteria bacterium]